MDFGQLDYIANSRILIAECTFYEVDHEGRAEAGRHMHIKELAHLLSCMKNEHIVITHTTQRRPCRKSAGCWKRPCRRRSAPNARS